MQRTDSNVSRRSFITGGLLVGAAAAAGSAFYGCSPSGDKPGQGGSSTNTPVDEAGSVSPGYANPDKMAIPVQPDSTEEADVVVLGSGLGGFAASMVIKEQVPEASVVMLEKLSSLGGNTSFAEGTAGFVNVPPEEVVKVVQHEIIQRNFVVDASLFTALKTQQGDCHDWLIGKQGVVIKDYGLGMLNYDGGNGSSMIATLTPQAESLGIDIRTSSRACALVLEDEYTVTGVQYRDEKGAVTQINAKAVVVATGGMSTNPELLELYSNVDLGKVMPLGEGQDGDGHLMVEQTAHGRTGLQTMDCFFAAIGTAEDPCGFNSDLNTAAAHQFSDCFVNEYGNRWYDESFSFNTGAQILVTCISQMVLSQNQAYSIFDASYVDRWEAGEWQNPTLSIEAATEPGRAFEIKSEIDRVSKSDWFYQADTIQELGEMLAANVPGFSVENFVSTIEAYNAAAAGTQPDEFGKPKEFVWALQTPPFYAAKLGVNAFNTNGGIRINTSAQVVDPNGKPITGLYASGIATHGWDSQVYGLNTNQPVALWCSCAAARDIVQNVLGKPFADDWMGDKKVTSMFDAKYFMGPA